MAEREEKADFEDYVVGDYIPPAPMFQDLKAAKVEKDRKHRPPGLKMSDTVVMLVVQVFLMIIYGIFVTQDAVPKKAYPTAGPGERVELIDFVQPFKRYPPGFDNFFGSARNDELKLQEHYSSFMQINIFVFLSLPWSFSFLRKFSYSSSTFALFTACVSIQFGIIVMQFVDRIHCLFLDGLLQDKQYDISPDTLKASPASAPSVDSNSCTFIHFRPSPSGTCSLLLSGSSYPCRFPRACAAGMRWRWARPARRCQLSR
jgi:hypothetical protein